MTAQQLANGVALGSIYALVALGFTMIYGVLFFVNLPHGEVMMVGGYIALYLMHNQLPLWLVLILAMILTAALGVTIEIAAYRRMRHSRRLAPVMSALGVSLALANGVMLLAGPESRSFELPLGFLSSVQLGQVTLTPILILIFVVSLLLMGGLHLFLQYTRLGVAIRATSQDYEASMLMGVDLNRTVGVTFAIGSALAAAAGLLLAGRYGAINPSMGFPVMLKAFAACVVGGIGSIPGAVLGAMVIGLTEVAVVAYLGSGNRDIGVFLILLLVLLFKPSGLLAGRTEVKV